MPAVDDFSNNAVGGSSPATHAAVVTPNDSADLANVSRALSIAVSGDLKVTTLGGETVVLPVVAGILPLRVTRVHATSTTATGIVALW